MRTSLSPVPLRTAGALELSFQQFSKRPLLGVLLRNITHSWLAGAAALARCRKRAPLRP
jgi:hypothetical protein